MNSLVIYKSKTGFTKKYAGWIAEALCCEATPVENARQMDLSRYDALIFGGWFFVGSIKGLKEFRESFFAFKGKKAVFVTGATPFGAPETVSTLDAAFTREERENTGVFYLRGGLDYSRMGLVHKAMMSLMCQVMKKEHGVDSEEYKALSQSFDASDRNAILPLIEYITQKA